MSNDPADKLDPTWFGSKSGNRPNDGLFPAPPRAQQTSQMAPEPAFESRPPKPGKRPQLQKAPKQPKRPKAPKAQKPPRAPKAAKQQPPIGQQFQQMARGGQPAAPVRPGPDKAAKRLEIHLPAGKSAAFVIGAVVGAFLALAVWFTGQVSQWVRGTSSLGGFGAPVLVILFALSVYVGGYLLKATRTASAYTISFLGSALVAVLSMLFLLGLFNSIWGALVVVALTAVAYTLSYWVTTSYIDKPAEDEDGE